MGGFYTPAAALGPVRVIAFSGRESDAPLGIWGAIAEQLGKKERFNEYYTPLAAPGQTAWVNLLEGEPLVIMLDELPPYFENAASKSIGDSNLSVVTTTALSNLLVALGRPELGNVCLVISDLRATYDTGAAQIHTALNHMEAETDRVAMNLEPVRMNTDEFYHILRKRIFETLPDNAEIEQVAQGYAQAVREAKLMDVTNASPEQFAGQVVESYPFHPAIRDLYGRFRENQGFQQTRASLANVPNAVKGLTIPEIVADLCAPGRDISRLLGDVIARLATATWYLHTTNDGRLHLRNVQNLVARVTTTAGAYLRDQVTKELKERLTEMFKPAEASCYQRLLPLPAVDEIDIGPERVTLVVAEPHPDGLHPDLVTLYEQLTYRNRVGFLTGQRAFDSLLERARELKAINQIIGEMHEEGVADGDAHSRRPPCASRNCRATTARGERS